MEKARALVNVRDINLICQYYKIIADVLRFLCYNLLY